MTATVTREQRYRREHPCPICHGWESQARGKGLRCTGYLAEDGTAAFCSREESDVWSESAQCWVHKIEGNALPPPVRIKRLRRDEIPADALEGPSEGLGTLSATYEYQDVDGSVLFQALRYALPGGKKTFRQRRPIAWDAEGAPTRWARNLEGIRLVPYRLPEIVETAADDLAVFVVEGEKDVETLRSLGLVATCNPMGAGKWQETYAEYLTSRTCYLIPDNDEAGRRHMKEVQASLIAAGARAIMVAIGTLGEKGDVTDWVAAGGTTAQLAKMCAVEEERYERARLRRVVVEQMTVAELREQRYEDVRWIIPGILPEGSTLFAGKPKVGKSWLALDMALAVARGGTLFDGNLRIEQGDVLYLALEDTFRRLKSRIERLARDPHPGDANLTLRIVSPKLGDGGLDLIEEYCITHARARAIFVDTLGVFRGAPGKNSGGYLEDYAIFQTLKPIADLYNVAFVFVTHTRKSGAGEGGDMFDAVLGSTAQTGGTDTTMILDRDKDGKVTLYYRGRDVEEDKVKLVWDDEATKWLLSPDDARNPLHPTRQHFLDVLADAGPLTPAQLAERTGQKPGTTRSTLKRMLESGQLVKRADCYEVPGNTRENANNRTRPTPGMF